MQVRAEYYMKPAVVIRQTYTAGIVCTYYVDLRAPTIQCIGVSLNCGYWPLSETAGNECLPKIIINDTTSVFSNCNQHFVNLQTVTVSECCLIKLLPYILFEKYIYILALEIAGPCREPTLCQLYRHTFGPYAPFAAGNEHRDSARYATTKDGSKGKGGR